MNAAALLGVWTGTLRRGDGWEMKMTVSVLQPAEIGSVLGIFDIPLLPCSGTWKVLELEEQTLRLRAERLQGECRAAEAESLELLPDGTLLYVATSPGWETRAVLERTEGP